MSDEIIVTPPAPIVVDVTPVVPSATSPDIINVNPAVGVPGPQGPVGATGPTGATGPSGIINVASPITNTGTSTLAYLGLDQTALSIAGSQVTSTVSSALNAQNLLGTITGTQVTSTVAAATNAQNLLGTITGTQVTSTVAAATNAQNLLGSITAAQIVGTVAAATNAQNLLGSITAGQVNGTAAVLNVANTFTATQTVPSLSASTITSTRVTITGTAANDTDAVTKAYVDTVASGLNAHDAVAFASVPTDGNTLTGFLFSDNIIYNNGTSGLGATLTNNYDSGNGPFARLSMDGSLVATNSRVLIKDIVGTYAAYNGIYVVSTAGIGGARWVLTRATDNDQPPELATGDFTYVLGGNTNARFTYVITSAIATVGTDVINWSVLSNGNFGAVVAPNQGGTGLTTYSTGDLIYASSSTAFARRSIGTNGFTLTASNGVPIWQRPTQVFSYVYNSALPVVWSSGAGQTDPYGASAGTALYIDVTGSGGFSGTGKNKIKGNYLNVVRINHNLSTSNLSLSAYSATSGKVYNASGYTMVSTNSDNSSIIQFTSSWDTANAIEGTAPTRVSGTTRATITNLTGTGVIANQLVFVASTVSTAGAGPFQSSTNATAAGGALCRVVNAPSGGSMTVDVLVGYIGSTTAAITTTSVVRVTGYLIPEQFRIVLVG